MARILPFKGLRYNQEKVSNLASVVTPPYDIIDELAQARYYAEHPANIIRLELGLTFPQDNESNNRYSRARQYLDKWIEDEILLPESQPSLYLYQQAFDYRGHQVVRTGLVCGLQVEDYSQGNILPHEETLSKPKADRMQLMQATQCNFSSIFGLYADHEKLVDQLLQENIQHRAPNIDIRDEAGESHRIWVVSDPEVIARVVDIMAEKKIYIADGHHRFETALEYAKSMKEKGFTGYDYVLTTLVNLYDEGLVVFPTHRLVGNVEGFKQTDFVKKLSTLFQVEPFSGDNLQSFMDELETRDRDDHAFGLYAEGTLYFLELKDPAQASQMLPQEKSPAWKDLDVAILDNLVLDQILHIGEEERRNQDNLAYTRSEKWLVEQVDAGQYQLGLILNATRVQEIVDVANARDKMPQKSTYFYPKLITGLIINNLNIK
ncbi:MAG TPA: DUF1015 domain-containing protein [Syntrophomonadaceae bacterium]|nr:DUF1015 domain-containing protein [Syntrophomonadaceae bacterium]